MEAWKHATTPVEEKLANTDRKAGKKHHSFIRTQVVLNRCKLYGDLTDKHTNKDDLFFKLVTKQISNTGRDNHALEVDDVLLAEIEDILEA